MHSYGAASGIMNMISVIAKVVSLSDRYRIEMTTSSNMQDMLKVSCE